MITLPDSMPFSGCRGTANCLWDIHVALDYPRGLQTGETLLVLGAAGCWD